MVKSFDAYDAAAFHAAYRELMDMTTQVRFGVSGESLLNSGDDEFLAAVEWRGDGLKQLAEKTGDSDLSLRTIGLCWKQQAADRAFPKLSGPVEFSSLNSWEFLNGDRSIVNRARVYN